MSKTHKAIPLAILALLTVSIALGAYTSASIAYPPSPAQMFTNSDAVFTGTVLDVTTRWGEGNESIIITVVRLDVEGLAKGEPQGNPIEVNIPGGQMGDVGVWVEDQPTFTVGEHVLLYLRSVGSKSRDGYPLYTLTTGTFAGKSDAAGNTTIGANGEPVPINPRIHSQGWVIPSDTSTTHAQLSLRYIEFSDDIFFVGEPITMRVGPIRSNQTGEYKAVAVVTPQIGGVEPSCESSASYSKDSNWFTFNFVLRETGNYTITIWQGGVKQLTREISVGSNTSTGGGATPNPEAARAAEEAARSPQTVDHILSTARGSGTDAISTPSLGVSIIILMAFIFSLVTIFNVLKRSS